MFERDRGNEHDDIYSNKKDASDFHGTVSFDPIKRSQQKNPEMYIKRSTHKSW